MTGINDFGGFGAQGSSSSSVNGTNSVPGTNSSQGNSTSISTLQKSELEALVEMLIAGLPILQPPSFVMTSFKDLNGGNVDAVGAGKSMAAMALQIEQKQHDIINSMWDSFLKNVHEIAERSRKEYIEKETLKADQNGPKSSSEYYAFLLALSSSQRAKEENSNTDSALAAQFNRTFNDWLVTPMQSTMVTSSAVPGYPAASFVAGCVACSSDLVRDAIGAVGVTIGYQISSSPVADALFAVGPASALPADYQAAAALVAALLNGGAMFKATNDTIEKAASGGKPPQDLDFAVNYAQNIKAIVTHNLEGDQKLPPEQAGQNRMMRLMLSAMALNMVYRAAYGGMTGQELADILAGKTGDIPAQIKPLIDELVGYVNAFMPQEPAARAETLARLMQYVDGKSSVDSMLSTTRMFAALLGTDDIDGKRFGSSLS